MRFEGFLLSESRLKKIEYLEAYDLIQTEFSDSLEIWERDNGYIYRGVPAVKFDYAVGNGKAATKRKSRNTDNYSTLFFDNHSSWSAFPKRSESFICSTTYDRAAGYGVTGGVYNVLPANGTKIGVCPDIDIFGSFSDSIPNSYVAEVNQFIRIVIFCFNKDYDANLDDQDDNWNKLKKTFDIIKSELQSDSGALTSKVKLKSFIESMREIDGYTYEMVTEHIPFNGDMIEFLSKIYDPKKNGFSIKKAGQKLPKNKEVWMSGRCLFINTSLQDI